MCRVLQGCQWSEAGQTVPSQAALCFDLESQLATGRKGKKRGVQSRESGTPRHSRELPRAGWALARRCSWKPLPPGLPALGLALGHLPTSACCSVLEGLEAGPSGPHVGVLQA